VLDRARDSDSLAGPHGRGHTVVRQLAVYPENDGPRRRLVEVEDEHRANERLASLDHSLEADRFTLLHIPDSLAARALEPGVDELDVDIGYAERLGAAVSAGKVQPEGPQRGLLRVTDEPLLPVVDQHRPVAEALHRRHVVGDEHDRLAEVAPGP